MSQSYRYVRACAWGGPVLLVASIIFWALLGRNMPPYSAALDAQTFADRFRADSFQIRIGMIGELVFTVFYLTWGVAISKVMEAVERGNNVLSTLQIWGAGFTTVIFALACTTWLTGTFRAETMNPEISQMLYDLGWIQFDMAFTLTTLQLVALGVCFLGDRRSEPLFPRWVSWYSIWVGFLFFSLALMPFFKSGRSRAAASSITGSSSRLSSCSWPQCRRTCSRPSAGSSARRPRPDRGRRARIIEIARASNRRGDHAHAALPLSMPRPASVRWSW